MEEDGGWRMADGGWPAWKPQGSRSFGQSATNERKASATTPITLKRCRYPYLGLDMPSLPRDSSQSALIVFRCSSG